MIVHSMPQWGKRNDSSVCVCHIIYCIYREDNDHDTILYSDDEVIMMSLTNDFVNITFLLYSLHYYSV